MRSAHCVPRGGELFGGVCLSPSQGTDTTGSCRGHAIVRHNCHMPRNFTQTKLRTLATYVVSLEVMLNRVLLN